MITIYVLYAIISSNSLVFHLVYSVINAASNMLVELWFFIAKPFCFGGVLLNRHIFLEKLIEFSLKFTGLEIAHNPINFTAYCFIIVCVIFDLFFGYDSVLFRFFYVKVVYNIKRFFIKKEILAR